MTIINKWRGRGVSAFLPILVVASLMVCSVASAQTPQTEDAVKNALDTIPEEARAVFNKYVQQQDTAKLAEFNKHRKDKFIKRISFHTNVVDWATLVPNIGIEIDLKDTPRNNYSIFLHGKFNGGNSHGKLVYNVNAVRVEGRKYWRTGKFGKETDYHATIKKLYTDTASIYFNADTFAAYSYYRDTLPRAAKRMGIDNVISIRVKPDMTQAQIDSLDFAEDSIGIRKNSFRNWVYNTYNKVRRNVTSGRTLENPRNWRAYYLGLWAGYDDWSISLTGKGKQGIGFGAGAVVGYTIPLLPQGYPREGSLDLDLGLAVGWKAVKYQAYTYESQTQHYMLDLANSSPGWKIVPYPIIQDIHVSLVWRFRGIKHKVDKSLIDEYEKKWIAKYNERLREADNYHLKVVQQRKDIEEKMRLRAGVMLDSTKVWDAFHHRRLSAALTMNPDTVFSGEDQELHLKIFLGLKSQAERERYLKTEKEKAERIAREKAKQDRLDAKKQARLDRQYARERADSIRDARRDSIRMSKKRPAKIDSTVVNVNDSSLTIQGDSLLSDSLMLDSTIAIQPDSISVLSVDSVDVQPSDTTVAIAPVDSVVVQPSDTAVVVAPVDSVIVQSVDTTLTLPQDSVPVSDSQVGVPVENEEEQEEKEEDTDLSIVDVSAIRRKWGSIVSDDVICRNE